MTPEAIRPSNTGVIVPAAESMTLVRQLPPSHE
jgi:hypothetical protein